MPLQFIDLGNNSTYDITLPNTLTHLVGKNISKVPQSLTHLSLSFVPTDPLPPSLVHLSFETSKHPLTCLPSLTSLKVGKMLMLPITLPSSLATLELGMDYFVTPLTFPPALTTLKLGQFFISTLEDFPRSLTSLDLSASINFTNSLRGIPPALITLKLNDAFNSPLYPLPATLQHLFVIKNYDADESRFNQPLDSLPSKLVTLEIHADNFHMHINRLPASVRNIVLDTYVDSSMSQQYISRFPPNLTHLTLQTNFNQPVRWGKSKEEGAAKHIVSVPSSLQSLKFGDYFNQPLISFPPSLTSLSFGRNFNKALIPLPPSLTSLSLDHDFNHPLIPLPKSLISLSFGNNFNHPLIPLPPTLVYLSFGDNFNQPLLGLPSSLLTLKLGRRFNHPITHLPPTLSELRYPFSDLLSHFRNVIYFLQSLGNGFHKPFDVNLPYLQRLTLGSKYEYDVNNSIMNRPHNVFRFLGTPPLPAPFFLVTFFPSTMHSLLIIYLDHGFTYVPLTEETTSWDA